MDIYSQIVRTGMAQHELEPLHIACLQALIDAYEQARSDGLCADGAWEVARQQVLHGEFASVLQLLDIPLEPPSE